MNSVRTCSKTYGKYLLWVLPCNAATKETGSSFFEREVRLDESVFEGNRALQITEFRWAKVIGESGGDRVIHQAFFHFNKLASQAILRTPFTTTELHDKGITEALKLLKNSHASCSKIPEGL